MEDEQDGQIEEDEEQKDGEKEDIQEKPLLDKKEAAIKESPEFKNWLKHAKGYSVLIALILKFCESQVDDGDDDFESESDEEIVDDANDVIVDDTGSQNIWPLLQNIVPEVFGASIAMTLYANVPFAAQETLDLINEKAFRCLTALMWAKPEEVLNTKIADKPFKVMLVVSIHNLIE